MSASPPWSVKGIDPRARDAAKDLARRQGVTLGELLNRMFIEDEVDSQVRRTSPPFDDTLANDDLTRVTLELDRLTRRLDAGEHKTALSVAGVERSVLTLSGRLDEVEHASKAAFTRLDARLDEVRETQHAVVDRLRRMEDRGGGPALDALKGLEAALSRLAEKVERLEHAPPPAQASAPVDDALARRLEEIDARQQQAIGGLADALAGLQRRMVRAELLDAESPEEALRRLLAERLPEVIADAMGAADLSLDMRPARPARGGAAAVRTLADDMARATQALEDRLAALEKGLADQAPEAPAPPAPETLLAQQVEALGERMDAKIRLSEERTAAAFSVLGERLEALAERLAPAPAADAEADLEDPFKPQAPFAAPAPAPEPPPAMDDPFASLRTSEPPLGAFTTGEPARQAPPPLAGPPLAAAHDPLLDPPQGGRNDYLAAARGAANAAAGVRMPARGEPPPEIGFSSGPFATLGLGASVQSADARRPAPARAGRSGKTVGAAPSPSSLRTTILAMLVAVAAVALAMMLMLNQRAPSPQPAAALPPEAFAPAAAPPTADAMALDQAAATDAAAPAVPALRTGEAAAAAPRSIAGAGLPAADQAAGVREPAELPSAGARPPAPRTAAPPPASAPVAATPPAARPPAAAPQAAAAQTGGRISLAQAAQRGDPVAQYEFGQQRLRAGANDDGVAWIRRAADQGLAMAQYRLAKMHERGEAGVPRDLTEARRWTQRAADAGNRQAMHNLAVFNAQGEGAPQDMQQAAALFTRAARQGVGDSQFNLGALYEQGVGVQRSPAEAAFWYGVAGRGGDAEANRKAAALESALSAAEREAIRRRVQTFRPDPGNPRANGQFGPPTWSAEASG